MFKKSMRGASSVIPFAHLLGLGAKNASEEDDKAETDEEDDKAEASEDDDDEKASKTGKAKRSDDDSEASEEDDDDKAENEDDDDKAEASTPGSRARKAERSRWSTVLSHPAAGAGRVATACQLLSTTELSAKQIIGTLKTVAPAAATAPTGRSSLYDRMASVKDPKIGQDGPKSGKPGAAGGPATTPAEMVAKINAAAEKVRGKPRT